MLRPRNRIWLAGSSSIHSFSNSQTKYASFFPKSVAMSENICPNLIPSSPNTKTTTALLSGLNSAKFIRRRSRIRCVAPARESTSPFDSVPDQVIVLIFTKLPESQRKVSALVCKRWLRLQGRLAESIRVLDWGFLTSGRLVERFRDLRVADLVDGCVKGGTGRWWNVVLSRRSISIDMSNRLIGIDSKDGDVLGIVNEDWFLRKADVDEGLRVLACGFPRMRKLVTVAGTEMGLLSVAEGCSNLEELELRRCCDNTLRAIAALENLRVLRLNGNVGGGCVTDTGLTILAQGCTLLVKLELGGCEGSYDGIKAIGQCCHLLEELIISDHRFDEGWLAGISYFRNLKSLSFQACKRIDDGPGPDEEYLSCCPCLERLHLEKCHLRRSESLKALFMVCEAVEEIAIHDCWGLTDEAFILMQSCRRVTLLSLEGCSLITTMALEAVVLSMSALEKLKVVSCKNVKNSELSLSLSALFIVLQELKWMPDAKPLLSSNFTTAIGRKGGKFFKK